MPYLIFAAAILIIVVLAVTVIALRRPARPRMPVGPLPPSQEEVESRLVRRRALEGQEDELLHRRVQLDSRRGMLGGDSQLFDALETLEQRYQAGEIDEDRFEAEKIRLLGG